ncbi:MAG: transcription antitermination factor NusB [Acidobacteriota bacterium]
MNLLKPVFFILKEYFANRQSNLKIILNKALSGVKGSERNSISRIVYGVVRKELLLSFIIKDHSERNIRQIDKDTLILLETGIFLLLFSSSYPSHAIVNEIINFANKRSKPFLNAILRKISGNSEKIRSSINEIKDRSIKYSISDVLIDNLKKLDNNLDNSLGYLDSEPLFHLRINKNITDLHKAEKILESENIDFRTLTKTETFEVKKAGKIIRKLFSRNYFYFQNTGSQAVSLIAAEFAGNKVLDCCAAPGTKSTTLNMRRPDLQILSSDINPGRIRMFKEFSASFQLSNIFIIASDIFYPPFKNDFDLILLDAPCTSAGTLRKNPDLKLKISKDNILKNRTLQKQMVSSVLKWAKKGTYILYSVCSFIEDETEGVIKDIINENSSEDQEISVSTVKINKVLTELGFRIHKGDYGTYLLPDDNMNNDLFYISMLQKF